MGTTSGPFIYKSFQDNKTDQNNWKRRKSATEQQTRTNSAAAVPAEQFPHYRPTVRPVSELDFCSFTISQSVIFTISCVLSSSLSSLPPPYLFQFFLLDFCSFAISQSVIFIFSCVLSFSMSSVVYFGDISHNSKTIPIQTQVAYVVSQTNRFINFWLRSMATQGKRDTIL